MERVRWVARAPITPTALPSHRRPVRLKAPPAVKAGSTWQMPRRDLFHRIPDVFRPLAALHRLPLRARDPAPADRPAVTAARGPGGLAMDMRPASNARGSRCEFAGRRIGSPRRSPDLGSLGRACLAPPADRDTQIHDCLVTCRNDSLAERHEDPPEGRSSCQ
jgi:hypothetical protein